MCIVIDVDPVGSPDDILEASFYPAEGGNGFDDLIARNAEAVPPTIPAAVRSAITRALGHQFEFADELDEWLHAPNEGLAGATPFECVVDGDGLAVLRALGASDELLELRGRLAGYMRDVRLALKLER